MISWDFLKKAAETPLREYYLAAGAICAVSTNFEPILDAARESFLQVGGPQTPADLYSRFWVDTAAQARPPWPQPYFRGLDHLVFAGFDTENSLLIDLRRHRAIGRFSPAMAADRAYWKTVIFPALLGIVGASVGIAVLHCACAVRDGSGLLLAGGSGSGKSTLSLALAMNGFALVSDDWTYFSRRDGRLLAWGLPTALKLLPDAVEHFPELAGLQPGVALNGERAYEVEPEQIFGVRRSRCCEPRWLIFLERDSSPGFRLTEMPPAEAASRFGENLEDLPAVVPEARSFLLETINRLVERQCWLLQYGGRPRAIAQALARFCESASEVGSIGLRCE